MKVAILYNQPIGDSVVDQDVLLQRDAVRKALEELAHEVLEFACDLDLNQLQKFLLEQKPDVVFNLVESLGGSDRLISIVPSLLEILNIPYTGCNAKLLNLTSDKIEAKKRMKALGLPTPEIFLDLDSDFYPNQKYIIKPVYEHASFALDDGCIVSCETKEELLSLITARSEKYARPFFAEMYIEGREFNVSIISAPGNRAMVLPVAEMEFSGFPEDKPKIFGFDAKWSEESFEYENINRIFKDFSGETDLVDSLQKLSLESWSAFNLQGYVRVDLRVDLDNNPYILEINANPCLTPLCGFPTALQFAGVSYTKAVDWMLEQALED